LAVGLLTAVFAGWLTDSPAKLKSEELTLLVSGSNLRWPLSNRVEVTYPNRSEMYSHGLVTGETSVAYETSEFVTTFQVTDVFVTTDTSILLSGNGTIFGYPGSPLQYYEISPYSFQ
jgi:hypothetical protein